MPAPLPLGNDVVDLQSAHNQASAENPRFLDRVLAVPEREALASIAIRGATFWAYWAAKEAAYKALKKTNPDLIFAHRHFIVDTTTPVSIGDGCGTARGKVLHANQSVAIMWAWTENWVHCVTGNDFSPRSFEVGAIDALRGLEQFAVLQQTDGLSDESTAARLIALDLLRERGVADAKIVRPMAGNRPGPPQILQRGNLLANFDISLSHDGRFAAAAIREL